MIEKTKVDVLGYGNIGKSVCELIENSEFFTVNKVFDRNAPQLTKTLSKPYTFTDNLNDILADDSCNAVVEVLGGFDFAAETTQKILLSSKSVITANKEVVVGRIKQFTELAEANGVTYSFEASVGGGIPLIRPISSICRFDEAFSIFGILNGTTNYILTRMQKDGAAFSEALDDARRAGFAEANPIGDLSGADMMRKIAILSMLAYHISIDSNCVYSYGIQNISKDFLSYVNGSGYLLKLCCYSSFTNGQLSIGVQPFAVASGTRAANTNYEFNYAEIDFKHNGKLSFSGKGAGPATACAIMTDLFALRNKTPMPEYDFTKKYTTADCTGSFIYQKDGVIRQIDAITKSKLLSLSPEFYAQIY